jgi:hypothetical protein
MPKTTPVPATTHAKIRECSALNPEASNRWIAKQFGLHHKTVGRILAQEPSLKTYGEFDKGGPPNVTPTLTETSEIKDDKWTISLPKTRICTLEELVEQFKIDLQVWEVERWVANKWEMGAKDKNDELQVEPLYQVKAFLKKRKNIEDAKNEIESLKEQAKSEIFRRSDTIHIVSPEDLMLELTLPDVHFGKLAWGTETGHANYDVKIAEQVYWEALETVLDRASHRFFNSVLFVVGNDILNSDDIEGRTTAGTYVSSDARYHKTFSAVRNTMVRSIERLREVASVKVLMVSGNHDQLSCWHLGDSLDCFFHRYSDVEIDNSPRQRKYHEHGNVGLMFTHGHKAKRTEYPALFASEQPKMWGRTKFRECHTGHLHMTKTDEQHGFRTRVLPSLTAPDDWLATNGFVGNLRNAEGYVWSGKEGLVEQVYYTVQE